MKMLLHLCAGLTFTALLGGCCCMPCGPGPGYGCAPPVCCDPAPLCRHSAPSYCGPAVCCDPVAPCCGPAGDCSGYCNPCGYGGDCCCLDHCCLFEPICGLLQCLHSCLGSCCCLKPCAPCDPCANPCGPYGQIPHGYSQYQPPCPTGCSPYQGYSPPYQQGYPPFMTPSFSTPQWAPAQQPIPDSHAAPPPQ
jgi:hypothetical protein